MRHAVGKRRSPRLHNVSTTQVDVRQLVLTAGDSMATANQLEINGLAPETTRHQYFGAIAHLKFDSFQAHQLTSFAWLCSPES
jgi:hypothetical protein